MLKKLLLGACLTALAAFSAAAMDRAWDFTDTNVWNAKRNPKLSHEGFKTVANTPNGFAFSVGEQYGSVWFKNASEDLAKYPVLEIFQRGNNVLFSVLAYGDGEDGYGAERTFAGDWTGGERYYPGRSSFNLSGMARWKQGKVNRIRFTVSNSGEGTSGTIVAMALRRGVDTLQNGAFMLKDGKNIPFWNFAQGMNPKLVMDHEWGMMLCKVAAAGVATTGLDSLKPNKRYEATAYTSGACQSVTAVICDQAGKVLAKHELKAAKAGKMNFWKGEYTVPAPAFRGELQFKFAGAGAISDVMVEDRGGAVSWRAEWLWSPVSMKSSQECFFRKEFTISNPSVYKEALLQATCDDAFTLEVNNNRIFNYNNWSTPQCTDVKKYLLPGKNVITASGWNSGGQAGFLAELRLTTRSGKVSYIATDTSWLTRLSQPAENWRRVDPPENTKTDWVPARSFGKPPVGPWGTNVRYQDKMPEPAKQSKLNKGRYAKQKLVAKINRDLPFPRLEVNGKIEHPMLFGVRWRGDRSGGYKVVQDSGYKLIRVEWEFSFEAWQEDGTIRYDDLENAIIEMLTAQPDAKALLMIRITPPSWWCNKHPNELVKFNDGLTTGADGVFASPASEVYRKEIYAKFGEAVKHIEESWYGSAVLGYMPCNLRGPEWVIAAKHNCYPDYSEPMKRYFRNYLKEIYGSNEALQKAWNNPNVTLDTAELPAEARRKDNKSYFLGDDCQDIFDYNRAASRANVDTIATVLDTVKANAPDKLRFLYFGYLMTMDHISMHPAISAHYDLQRLLNMGKVDVMASPISYRWRQPGDISGTGSVESSYAKHGILWLQEADNRTYLTELDGHAVTHHAAASLQENWREFVYAMLKREAIWFYDLGGDWYSNAFFPPQFKKMIGLYNSMMQTPATYAAPMAYFFDEKGFDGVALNQGNWGPDRPFTYAADCQRMAAVCGVPYDMFELDDIYDLDLAQYKVLVFPNAWRKNDKLAKFLAEKVYPAGKTAVWLYAPGYGQKGGTAGMKDLTGMSFAKMPALTPLAMHTKDGRDLGNLGTVKAEVFAANVPTANVLATYPGTQKAAAAWKAIGKGKSVWMSAFDPSGKMLREVLVSAGVTLLVDRADRVVCDGKFLGVIATDGPGVRTATCPEAVDGKVTDVVTGKSYDAKGGKFQFYAEPGNVMLFQLK